MGSHPVNGNRQFGIAENSDNKYFYTKGVDRANNYLAQIFGYFSQDALWDGMIDNLKQWINNPTQDGIADQAGITTKTKLGGGKTATDFESI